MPDRSGELQVGSQRLQWGSHLQPMVDSTHLYREGRVTEWTAVLQRDGYLLVRGVVPALQVLRARECLCEALHRDWNNIDVESAAALAEAPPAAMIEADQAAADDPTATMSDDAVARLFASTPLLRARIKPMAFSSPSAAASSEQLHSGLLLTGYRPVSHDQRVLDVLEGPQLARLFAQLFGQLEAENAIAESASSLHSPAATIVSSASVAPSGRDCTRPAALASPSTFDTKWIRVMSRGDATEEHTDYYRFEHFAETDGGSGASADGSSDSEDGARHMFTCWLPLGHYTTEHGTLAVAEGSHRLGGYKRGVYGSSECKDELPPDFARWVDGDAENGSGGVWRTSDFAPGDVVVFDIRLVHASTPNARPHFRLSMDTRWKPTALVLAEQRDAFRVLPVPHDAIDSSDS